MATFANKDYHQGVKKTRKKKTRDREEEGKFTCHNGKEWFFVVVVAAACKAAAGEVISRKR